MRSFWSGCSVKQSDLSMGDGRELQIWDCSPRAGGHTQAIQSALVQALLREGVRPLAVSLREYQVWPCQGCQRCSRGGECPLAASDACEQLFDLLCAARTVCFVAPIYFYHLPAPFKAFIDRSQRVYAQFERDSSDCMPQADPRPAFALLHAGRSRGEHLFAGSILTLRFFLRSFGLVLEDVHTVRGMDGVELHGWPDALSQAVHDVARQMAPFAGRL